MLVETFCSHGQEAYATLLNCWKFLRASSYQVEFSPNLNGLLVTREGVVTSDEDVTMDNQQPSPN